MNKSEALLDVQNLSKHFVVGKSLFDPGRTLRAVDDVTFTLARGESLGVVGESGCGKSTLGRTLLRLYEPTSGRVLLQNEGGAMRDFATIKGSDLKQMRRKLQMVFQDPSASLNPRMTVRDILREPFAIHKHVSGSQVESRLRSLIAEVGLREDTLDRFPYSFSGGQRQRIGIARALALEPELIILDEPVSALDVSIRSQVLNLLKDLQQSRGLSYVFISHDLAAVQYLAQRIAVMYLGRIVELADAREFYAQPRHPYSMALMAAVPVPDPKLRQRRRPPVGSIPSPLNPPFGCHFHTRCPFAQQNGRLNRCSTETPALRAIENSRLVRCHFAEDIGSEIGPAKQPGVETALQ